jgi:protein tyrosine phosphatase|tara:strand:+ start:509 stop:964 length:456 start_codon:yes stop_codon:yes gene_type:complete
MINNFLKKIDISNHQDLIISNIYIGNYESSIDNNFLEKNKIKLIINCTKHLKFNNNFNDVKIRIPIDDNRIFKNYDILKYLDILNIIDTYRKKNHNILIHCYAGSQRSANIVLLYLIKKLKLSYNISYEIIKQIRPICFFPINNFNHIFDN